MSRCKLLVGTLFLFVMSLFMFSSSVMAQEVNEDYQNYAIDPQTGVFVATFNAKSTADMVDGVLGLAKNEPASYDDYSCKLLFNNEGFIKASNGASFEAD